VHRLGDTSVTNLMTFKTHATVDETGEKLTGGYKLTMVDATGKVTLTDSGESDVFFRMHVEPFETPSTPEATPGA
jgi:hypothetical protein